MPNKTIYKQTQPIENRNDKPIFSLKSKLILLQQLMYILQKLNLSKFVY